MNVNQLKEKLTQLRFERKRARSKLEELESEIDEYTYEIKSVKKELGLALTTYPIDEILSLFAISSDLKNTLKSFTSDVRIYMTEGSKTHSFNVSYKWKSVEVRLTHPIRPDEYFFETIINTTNINRSTHYDVSKIYKYIDLNKALCEMDMLPKHFESNEYARRFYSDDRLKLGMLVMAYFVYVFMMVKQDKSSTNVTKFIEMALKDEYGEEMEELYYYK